MKNEKNKQILYVGLLLLLIAIVCRYFNAPSLVWIPIFSVAIVMKAIFLINVFRTKDFKMSLWLILIIVGVAMILISLLFRFVFPIPWLRNILFYGAISLKIAGLVLMFVERIKQRKTKKTSK